MSVRKEILVHFPSLQTKFWFQIEMELGHESG